jgi:hypothetical protein
MKRHIGGGQTTLTLCGIYAPYRNVSDPEIGSAPLDLCQRCARIHQKEVDRELETKALLARTERAIARADAILSKPCCDGRCGAP